MSFWFHRAAEREFEAAIEYYEGCEPGLGIDFAREVLVAIRLAERNPSLWTELAPDVRRLQVHRFPYGIIYSFGQGSIGVLAVMHLRRDPDYWRQRVDG